MCVEKEEYNVKPIIRLMQTLPGQKVRCGVHKEPYEGTYLRLGDKDTVEHPQIVCRECVRLLSEIMIHRVYVYKWERQKK